ncbi:MAG: hypothetical protein A2X49_03825 [Lentisphaerae bacterium GWF2_52_8]|nr:MAG: hypothetical protein A2X49_03825 [Lentisphaerae bacterium GWF2_52_8]
MNRKFMLVNLSFAALLVMLLCACQTAPYTGRSQFIVTSEAQESQLGEDAWKEVCSQEKISNNASQNAAVSRVGRDIANSVNKPGYKWEFRLFESAEPNAFCLPGGKVAVYTAIFKYMDNDAELAAVVGHEIGHAVARHGGERMSQALAQQLGAEAVSVASGDQYRSAFLLAYGFSSNVGVMLPYSRTQEYEADRLGMIFMAQAGYDPNANISFWEKFGQSAQMSRLEEYFSTHPMSEKRLEEMRKNLPEAMGYYQKAVAKKGLGQSYRASVSAPASSSAAAKPASASANKTKPGNTVNTVGEPQNPLTDQGSRKSGGASTGSGTTTIKRQYEGSGKTASPAGAASSGSSGSQVIKRKYGTVESN